MPGVESQLPEGWERSETTSGIPYYIDHETECTSWDHPEMVKLLQEIAALNNIKYAAYRTAMKLRAIQKRTQMCLLDLPIIITTLQEDVRDSYTEKMLTATDVHRIITSMFIKQNGDRKDFIDIPMASDLTFNWILNTFDQNRTGFIQSVSLKVGLSFMCAAKIQDKYKYIFRQLCNSKGWMDRRRLKMFLQESLQIPRNIYESAVFSGTSVEPAVKNCFERTGAVMDQLNLEDFLSWMIAEPQTVVWLPTLHRLAVSEDVKHEAKCNICKMYPIVGFRYRCLKCFNFDLCQECFWLGRTNKKHKVGHQTQEYCLSSSQKEDFKDFAKVMKNKVSKKKKPTDPSKGRYISIANEDAAPSSDEEYTVDGPSVSNAVTHDKLGSYAAKLADYDEVHDRKPRDEFYRSGQQRDDKLLHSSPRQGGMSTEPNDSRETSLQLHSPSGMLSDMNIQQRDELEDLISNLEDDNRALRDEIDHIHQLQLQNLSLDTHQSSEEAERLRQRKERLLAREEVLESHNQQLEIQLHRLRSMLHQDSPHVPQSKHKAVSPTIPYQPTPAYARKPDSKVPGLYLNQSHVNTSTKQSPPPEYEHIVNRNHEQPVTYITVSPVHAVGHSGMDGHTHSPLHAVGRSEMESSYTPSPDDKRIGGYTPSPVHTVGRSGMDSHTQSPLHAVGHSEMESYTPSPDGKRIGGYTPSYTQAIGRNGIESYSQSPVHAISRNGMEGYTHLPDGRGIGGHTPSSVHAVGAMEGHTQSPVHAIGSNGMEGYTHLPDGKGMGGYTPSHTQAIGHNGIESYSHSPINVMGLYNQSPINGMGEYNQSPNNGISGHTRLPDNGMSSHTRLPDNGMSGYTRSPDNGRVGYSHSPLQTMGQNGRFPLSPDGRVGNSFGDTDLQTIVDRMISCFPLTEAESDISMELHSDLFLAATMVGEAMQSLVTAVSRQGVSSSAYTE